MNKNIETVGELLDQLVKLPRDMRVWASVRKEGEGFDPCLAISHISADRKGVPGIDDCGIILDPDTPYTDRM